MANLSEMSNEQRETYRRKVSEAVGLDPEMQLLDFIWMPSNDGMKSLVLYCRRGAAEILRANRGISVTKMAKESGDGYVSFIVEGVDKTGRVEMAVGSSSTEGLRGEKLAHSVMTASTRALRRLTLQFAGHGLLDETEVSSQIANIASTNASLAQLSGSSVVIPPPQATPSAAPGKDITPVPSQNETATLQVDIQPAKIATNPALEPVQLEPAQTIARDYLLATQADIEPKKRGRPRKKRGQVDLSSPGQQTEMSVGQIDAQCKITPFGEVPIQEQSVEKSSSESKNTPNGNTSSISVPPATAKEPERGAIGNRSDSTPALPEAVFHSEPVQANPVASTQANLVPAPAISDLALKNYKERLRKYANEILPQHGMIPCENMGISTKLRNFSRKHLGVEDVAKFTSDQWDDLFDFLDNYMAKNGGQALVQYIDKALGVIQ